MPNTDDAKSDEVEICTGIQDAWNGRFPTLRRICLLLKWSMPLSMMPWLIARKKPNAMMT
ncbi:hypothetical protein HYR99_14415 [Candidatus Poribacteria bacterium]|nr:hypothetical protein [Candidatus Poribacteria bacterium]